MSFSFKEIPHPCHPNPCKNGARCKEMEGGEYDCECPPGTSGKHCEGRIGLVTLHCFSVSKYDSGSSGHVIPCSAFPD